MSEIVFETFRVYQRTACHYREWDHRRQRPDHRAQRDIYPPQNDYGTCNKVVAAKLKDQARQTSRAQQGKRLWAGRFDFEILILDRFHLTPDELYRLDPAFVDELQVYMEADAEQSRELAKAHDRG